MLSPKLAALFAFATIVACATSAVVAPVYKDNVTRSSFLDNEIKKDQVNRTISPEFTNEDDNNDDGENAKIDGIPLRLLRKEELNELLDDEDNIVLSDLDICVLRTIVEARNEDSVYHTNRTISKVRRRRFLPALFAAARLLFTGAARAARPTVSGSRITQQYVRKGSYRDAINHFNSLRPHNVKSFSGRISGRTGTVGNHRVTVRDGSKQGSPTLEIRTPRPNGEYVRKFRYER